MSNWPPHPPSQSKTKPIAICLGLLSAALFIVVGVIVRLLNDRIGVFQILLFRQLIFATLLLPVMVRNVQPLLRPRLLSLQLLRIVGAFTALSLGFVTVSHLPLAEATALGFTQVLFVAIAARLFLHEPVNTRRVIILLSGFVGVLLVVQPTFQHTDFYYVLTGLCAAVGAAVAVVCVRRIAQTEPTITLLAYQAIFVGLFALVPAMITWQAPDAHELLLLLAVGLISSLAQWLGVNAYKHGQANVISNLEYSKMIYSLLLGYWLFAEIPNSYALLGAALILGSAILPGLLSSSQKR